MLQITMKNHADGVNNDRDGTTVVSCIMFNTVHTPTMVIILCKTMAIMLSNDSP